MSKTLITMVLLFAASHISALDAPADTGGQTITATADVGGFPRECSTSSSCTASVEKKAVPAVQFGEYVTRDLSANDGHARGRAGGGPTAPRLTREACGTTLNEVHLS